MKLLVALAAVCCLLVTPAYADQHLADMAANNTVWTNTSEYTPPIYEAYSGSVPAQCWGKVQIDSTVGSYLVAAFNEKWANVPFVTGGCVDFKPSAGGDGEAVIRDYVHGITYEFWGMHHETDGWHARWGGADADANFHWSYGVRAWNRIDSNGVYAGYGVQASGLAFDPGTIKVIDLWRGRIDHPVDLLVPYACSTFKAPAISTDNGTSTDLPGCTKYGQVYKLPQDVDVSSLPFYSRLIAQAAKDYGLVVSDQTCGSWCATPGNRGSMGFRTENWKRPNSWWAWTAAQSLGEVNPYWDPAYPPDSITSQWGGSGFDYFGCTQTPANYSCYPDQNNLFHHFPWGQLVPIN